MTGDDVVLTVASARRSLDSACDDLDDAVRALPEILGDNVMASPGLVALLLRVVIARRQLAGVESACIGAGLSVSSGGIGSPDRTRWV